MKQFYILLVLLSFSQLHAQQITYQPFHEGTTTWLHENMIPWVQGGGADSYFYRTIWSGDTVINATHYTRIFRGVTYAGGIRQDIPNQKVYFVNTAGIEFDISISHFLEVGDSIQVTPALSNAFSVNSGFVMDNSIDWLIVHAKDSVQVNALEYRVDYAFAPANSPNNPPIRYTGGRGFNEYYDLGSGWFIRCYKEEDSVIYGVAWELAPWFQSCLASIQEEEINVTISPNPSSGKYQLTFGDNKSFTYEVVDVYGKRIVSLTDDPELDLTEFPSGIYVVCISGFEGTERKYKIVKE
ncbi:MAG: T9SS type A sorting domain-containing protein [Fluviicola sp.]|nr:T9SS type A sorting domain-containing protein [Fluviicola sp.]